MRAAARIARKAWSIEEERHKAKKTAIQWKKETRTAKWEYWEEKLRSATGREGWGMLTSLKGPVEKKGID